MWRDTDGLSLTHLPLEDPDGSKLGGVENGSYDFG
jgi:hypothetical protein